MRPSDSLKHWLGKTAQRYHESLDEETTTYLAARGLDQDAVRGSLLGLVVDPDPLHEPFRGRLSIPYITPTGIVSMRFRCLRRHDCKAEKCPKYVQPEGDRTHIYNVQALHDADTMVGICEGELDALVATIAGLPSVGTPGIRNFKPFYYRLFDDFERVLILGDGDKDGRSFTAKLAHAIATAEARALPDGYDVNSYVLEHGAEAFLAFACS